MRRVRPPLALAATALCLAAAGCCSCGGSPDFTFRARRARDPAPAAPLQGDAVRALHLADFGDFTCQQEAIANGVVAAHRKAPFDLALFPGDLVYPCGPDPGLPGADACTFGPDDASVTPGYQPPPDGRYDEHEKPLAPLAEAPAAEVLVSLGNHDVGAPASCSRDPDASTAQRRRACLEVAHRTPLWRMDARHWAADRGAARFLFLDSNLLKGDYAGFTIEGEVEFVRQAAAGCRADDCAAEPGGCQKPWCFVLAHHPAATAGGHTTDFSDTYAGRLGRVLEAGGGRLRAWLAGHDHDLQHVRAPSGLDVFVSGNGSRGRASERFTAVEPHGAELLYASVHWGYGVLEVAPSGWRYRFESEAGQPLYCCAAEGAGRCEPAACP